MSGDEPTADHLAAYLARTGYTGPREPTFARCRGSLPRMRRASRSRISRCCSGAAPALKTEPLADKIVRRRRGGYCFEQNTLMLRAWRRWVLPSEGLAGRVVWMRPADEIGPRTHMLLRVSLPEGPHLVDVGFGGLTLTAPIRLESGIEQQTPHEPHRLDRARRRPLELQGLLDGAWTPLYRFGPQVQFPIDYEVANWFTATHPNRLFTSNLMCARPDPDCRYALLNDRFTIRRRGQPPERRVLRTAGELGEVLARDFRLPTLERGCRTAWAKIAER